MAEDEDYLEPEGAMNVEPASEERALPEAVSAPPAVSAAEASEQKALLAEHRLAEVFAAYRKLKADHEGFRERTARNLERRFDQRVEQLLVKFIDVLDNFDRALEATEQTYAGEPLIEGLILVRTQLLQILQQEGLERIPVLGAPFDPHVAEAVGTQPTDDPDQHHIVAKEFQRGYRFRNSLIRPSRVVVLEYRAEGEPEADADPARSADPGAAAGEDIELLPTTSDDHVGSAIRPGGEPPSVPEDDDLSLDDIINRAEAQRALFPEGFEEPAPEEPAPEVQAAIIPPDEDEEEAAHVLDLLSDDEDEIYSTLEDDEGLDEGGPEGWKPREPE